MEPVTIGEAQETIALMMGFPTAAIARAAIKMGQPYRRLSEPPWRSNESNSERLVTHKISIDDVRERWPDLTRDEAREHLLKMLLLDCSRDTGVEFVRDSYERCISCQVLSSSGDVIVQSCVAFLDSGQILQLTSDFIESAIDLDSTALERASVAKLSGHDAPVSIAAGKLLAGVPAALRALVDDMDSNRVLPPLFPIGTTYDTIQVADIREPNSARPLGAPMAFIPGHCVPPPRQQVRFLVSRWPLLHRWSQTQAEAIVARVMGYSDFASYLEQRQEEPRPDDTNLCLHWTVADVRAVRPDLTRAEAMQYLVSEYQQCVEEGTFLTTQRLQYLLENTPSPWDDLSVTAHWLDIAGVERSARATVSFHQAGEATMAIDADAIDWPKRTTRGTVSISGTEARYRFDRTRWQHHHPLLPGETARLVDMLESLKVLPQQFYSEATRSYVRPC